MLTTLQQGWFISNGENKNLAIRSDVDWIRTVNYTKAAEDVGMGEGPFCVRGYWQRDMPAGRGVNDFKDESNAINVLDFAALSGFTLVDTSVNLPLAPVAITATSNVVRPIVLTGSTAGLQIGSVVRLSNVAAVPNIMGVDFSIDTIVANTSFRLAAGLANVPGAVGGAGFYRVIAYDAMFYPPTRQILNIESVGVTSVVTCSVIPNYTVGQVLRVTVPDAFGMVEMNGLQGTVLDIDPTVNVCSVTLDIDSSTFGTFVYPAPAAVPFSRAMLSPIGEVADTTIADPNSVDDAVRNITYIGMKLAGGPNAPAGEDEDVVYWVSGKTVDNQQDPIFP